MDKAWTTPPTAVPRAHVGCDAKSSRGVALPHESDGVSALHRGGRGRQTPGERHEELGGAFRALRERRRLCRRLVFGRTGKVLADRFHHVLKRTPTEVHRALAYVLLNARKHYRQRRRRVPPVVLDGASSGLWFDGWKGRGPPPGCYADADRPPEVASPRTWLLSKGWRRIGLVRRRCRKADLRAHRQERLHDRRVGRHLEAQCSGLAFGLTGPPKPAGCH